MGFKDLFKAFKDNGLGKTRKKKILENGALIIVLGLILIITGSSIFNNDETVTMNEADKDKKTGIFDKERVAAQPSKELETRIERTLAKIDGVGKVDVLITLNSNEEKVLAYDIKDSRNLTGEKDSGGGSREVSNLENDRKVVYEDSQSSGKKAVVIKELNPEVKGAVVVCDGANNSDVKENVISCVSVLLDIPMHKIKVCARKIEQ